MAVTLLDVKDSVVFFFLQSKVEVNWQWRSSEEKPHGPSWGPFRAASLLLLNSCEIVGESLAKLHELLPAGAEGLLPVLSVLWG